MKFIRFFDQVAPEDLPHVGGKNAALSQMITELSKEGIRIPKGFAITAQAYWYFLEHNNLVDLLKDSLAQVNVVDDVRQLKQVGQHIRKKIVAGTMPEDLEQDIITAYHQLSQQYKQKDLDVAVRSSATAEDLPEASFAGQQETFLNVQGDRQLIAACKKSFASLFTDRAIVYRTEKGFDHFQVALSIGVQKMVRSDSASSGVAFSLDTETGFKDIVMIESSWGLGESIVKGLVTPDEFVVFTPKLTGDFVPIIKKELGDKKVKVVCTNNPKRPLKQLPVSPEQQNMFSLQDDEILELARAVVTIDQYYTNKNNRWTPIDVEWAKDGPDGQLFIVQARPETIHSQKKKTQLLQEYRLITPTKPQVLVKGLSIGQKIVSGPARVIASVKEIEAVQAGDIIVTIMSDPDWVPAMKKAAAIVTQEGGRTCHAAIVSRELGIPALVGAANVMSIIKKGQEITVDCSEGSTGYVYAGAVPFDVVTTELTTLPKLPVKLNVNLGDPDSAFRVSQLPVDGVGLARIEFIISNSIKIHPMALIHPERVEDKKVRTKIEELTVAYGSGPEYFVDKLSYGIGTIAAAFYPRPIVVRLSDFKTNEYANLIGGTYFEPHEQNPMLGFRGASRYYDERYKEAFALECAALKKVREQMGLDNVQVMIPFVRTTQEAERVAQELQLHGLTRGQDDLKLIMMAEVPANVLLVDDFSKYVDGFSIGSNDLTQLTLGIDRDSGVLGGLFDERNPAVKKMFKLLIEGAQRNNRSSGICGQAPSDFPELAQFLIDCGIDSISLNPDAVIPFLLDWKK